MFPPQRGRALRGHGTTITGAGGGIEGTEVQVVGDAVAIRVTTPATSTAVAGITHTVAICITLGGVGNRGAVVHGVRHAIAICITTPTASTAVAGITHTVAICIT